MMRKFLAEGNVEYGDMYLGAGDTLRSVFTIKIDDRIKMKHVGLKHPHKEMVAAAIDKLLQENEKLVEEIKSLWATRVHKIGFSEKKGMSGCKDLFIDILEDEEYNGVSKVFLAHISMYSKVKSFDIWLGDLPYLLPELREELIDDEVYTEVSNLSIRELEVIETEDFQNPQELLEDGVVDALLGL